MILVAEELSASQETSCGPSGLVTWRAELSALELTASVAQARAALDAATASRDHVYAGVRAEEVDALAAGIARLSSHDSVLSARRAATLVRRASPVALPQSGLAAHESTPGTQLADSVTTAFLRDRCDGGHALHTMMGRRMIFVLDKFSDLPLLQGDRPRLRRPTATVANGPKAVIDAVRQGPQDAASSMFHCLGSGLL
jgi:hypothetical protein